MGPAYACAVIWLRLNPYCGDEEQADRRLLDLYRASIILEALTWEKKGEMAVVDRPYKEIVHQRQKKLGGVSAPPSQTGQPCQDRPLESLYSLRLVKRLNLHHRVPKSNGV